MTMTRRTRQQLALALGLLAGAGLFVYMVVQSGWQDVFSALYSFGPLAFLGFFVLSLLNFCVYTWRWRLILQGMSKHRISFFGLFFDRMAGFATGYLTPAAQVAGEPVRVAMLKTRGLSVAEATGSVVLDLAFEIGAFVAYVAAGILLAIFAGLGGASDYVLPLIFLGCLLGIVLSFFIFLASGTRLFDRLAHSAPAHRFRFLREFFVWLFEVQGYMRHFLQGGKSRLFSVAFLSFVTVGFRAVESFYLLYFLGVILSARDAILLSTLPGLALLLPIPGGLGIFEGSNAAAFTLLGLTVNAVAYTIVIRFRDALFILIGIVHAAKRGELLFERRT